MLLFIEKKLAYLPLTDYLLVKCDTYTCMSGGWIYCKGPDPTAHIPCVQVCFVSACKSFNL